MFPIYKMNVEELQKFITKIKSVLSEAKEAGANSLSYLQEGQCGRAETYLDEVDYDLERALRLLGYLFNAEQLVSFEDLPGNADVEAAMKHGAKFGADYHEPADERDFEG